MKVAGLPVTTEFSGVHMERFAAAVKTLADEAAAGKLASPPNEWELHYPGGKALELPMGSVIRRLREGVERFYFHGIGDPLGAERERAKVVVLHEELFDDNSGFFHGDSGVNVLYMDGHVAYLDSRDFLPGIRFPLNEGGYILRDAVDGALEFSEPGERVRRGAPVARR